MLIFQGVWFPFLGFHVNFTIYRDPLCTKDVKLIVVTGAGRMHIPIYIYIYDIEEGMSRAKIWINSSDFTHLHIDDQVFCCLAKEEMLQIMHETLTNIGLTYVSWSSWSSKTQKKWEMVACCHPSSRLTAEIVDGSTLLCSNFMVTSHCSWIRCMDRLMISYWSQQKICTPPIHETQTEMVQVVNGCNVLGQMVIITLGVSVLSKEWVSWIKPNLLRELKTNQEG